MKVFLEEKKKYLTWLIESSKNNFVLLFIKPLHKIELKQVIEKLMLWNHFLDKSKYPRIGAGLRNKNFITSGSSL